MSDATTILPVVSTALAGAAAFLSVGAYGLTNPASRMWGPVISRAEHRANEDRVALTFDDGPLPGSTDRVLDTLGEAGVRAAFFVIGRHVRQFPELVRRMHADGHLVANHSHDHLHSGLFGRYRYWVEELTRADDAIEEVIGRRPAIFRPPMGYKHWHVMNAAADLGHRVITWSRRAVDARAAPAEVILRRLVGPTRAGEVMLLHDGDDPCRPPRDRSGTCAAVRPLIEGLRRRGLEPVRLDDLLRIPPYRDPGRCPAPPPPVRP